MKLKNIDKKVLNYLHDEYRKRYGSSFEHLGDFRISMVDGGMKKAVPELYAKDSELEKMKAVFKKLSSKGLVTLNGNRDISLTDEGVSEASKTALGKFMDFLNANPGLAILIPLVSLTLAVIALFISTKT